MTITAYAIAEKGRLLVDTVRETECAAREAAIRLLKRPGVTWKALSQSGFALVRVHIAAGGREPAVAPPAPLPAQKTTVADAKPVRRYLTSPRQTSPWVRSQARHDARRGHSGTNL